MGVDFVFPPDNTSPVLRSLMNVVEALAFGVGFASRPLTIVTDPVRPDGALGLGVGFAAGPLTRVTNPLCMVFGLGVGLGSAAHAVIARASARRLRNNLLIFWFLF